MTLITYKILEDDIKNATTKGDISRVRILISNYRKRKGSLGEELDEHVFQLSTATNEKEKEILKSEMI